MARARRTWLPYRGGPLDGRWTAEASPLVERDGLVYRRGFGGYDFAGHASFRCEGCGGYVTPRPAEPIPACPLCGHARPSPPPGPARG